SSSAPLQLPPPSRSAPLVQRAPEAAAVSASRPAPRITQRPGASSGTTPEVLVPQDQEVLLASYSAQWRKRGNSLTARVMPEPIIEPLEVAPIRIEALDVKSMEEADAR